MAWQTIVCVATLVGTVPALAMADSAAFSIPAQPMPAALKAFANQANMEILYKYAEISGVQGNAVTGEIEKHKALEQLLRNTGLEAVYSSESAATIRPLRNTPPGSSGSGSPADADEQKEGKTQSSRDFRVAQLDQAQTPGPASPVAAEKSSPGEAQRSGIELQEVIVTAQKRNENIMNVPVPVTAVSAQTLVDNSQFRLQDYYTQVPGLNLTTDERGAPVLSIRGLTTSQTLNATVAQTIDDVPFGASSSAAFSWMTTDIDPNELARVEVLRGPQGTLYGSSTLGGLLKFVTVEPSVDALNGRIQVGTEGVQNRDGLGYNVNGSINAPLNDTLALRASGYARREAGYIDNVLTGQEGVNSIDAHGGRLSGLWKPSDDFSLRLDALIQDNRTNGSPWIDRGPGFSDLQQSEIRDSGEQDRRVWAYDAILKARIGPAELTSITGYNVSRWGGNFDVSYTYTPIFGIPGAEWFEDNQTDKLSQEVRLSMPLAQRLDWLFGIFYTHERTNLDLNILSVEPLSGDHLGSVYHGDLGVSYAEGAVFTDFTYRITDRLDIQIGGRESVYKQTTSGTEAYPPGSPFADPTLSAKDNAFTYLVTPRFKLNEDLMIYARFASGFRPGGANNPSPNPSDNVPGSYKPDTTVNYEIGAKGTTPGRLFSFDTSVYYIDWKNIQVGTCTPGCSDYFFENANRAKSQGVELSVQLRPITGLTFASWIAVNDAELTKPFPPEQLSLLYGVSGDRLPYSSRFSGNLSVEQEFPLTASLTGRVGGDVSYTSQRLGEFEATPQREVFPAYAKTNLHVGLSAGLWKVNLFANNVADKRALLSGGLSSGGNAPYAYTIIQPRTVGLTVSREF